MKYPAKLSPEFSGALRTFSFWMANGSVGLPLLEGIDYWADLKDSPSLMEEVYAIFANVLEFDENGVPTNAKYAEFRAAQCIRRWCDPSYEVAPPFEAWETELYAPPSKLDAKPRTLLGCLTNHHCGYVADRFSRRWLGQEGPIVRREVPDFTRSAEGPLRLQAPQRPGGHSRASCSDLLAPGTKADLEDHRVAAERDC